VRAHDFDEVQGLVSVVIRHYSGGIRQAWHSHDEALVTVVTHGSVRESVYGRGEAVIGAMSVGTKPIGLRHTDHFGPGGVHALRIGYSAEELRIVGYMSKPLEQWAWRSGSLVRVVLASLLSVDLAEAKNEIIAVLGGTEAGSGDPPEWLRRVRESILDCFRSPDACLTAIAGAHAVHPVYLARQYRRFYRESVGECIRRLRVQEAFRVVTASDLSLATVAAECGFSDQAHMTRLMHVLLGTTPAALRRRFNTAVRYVQDGTGSISQIEGIRDSETGDEACAHGSQAHC